VTSFGEILQSVVETTPGAIGSAFADRTGEMVDSFSTMYDAHAWAVLTAHYGVVMAHLHAAFGTWHCGGPEFFIAEHEAIGVLVHTVDSGYYALLAVTSPAPLAIALDRLRQAASQLKREMA
jgi:hypothetical protein